MKGASARRLVGLVLLLAAAGGCSGRGDIEKRRVFLCRQAVLEHGAQPSPYWLSLVRDACAPAFGPIYAAPPMGAVHPANPVKRWEHLMTVSDMPCSYASSQIQPMHWMQLLAECGTEHFSVGPGQAPFFGEEFYVGQRIGRWLSEHARQTDPDEQEIWDVFYQYTGRGQFVLGYPLVWSKTYVLPGSATPSIDSGAGSHLIVGAQSLTMGQTPTFRIGREGIELAAADFPGDSMELEDVPRHLANKKVRAVLLIADRDLPARRLLEVSEATPGPGWLLVAAQGFRSVPHSLPIDALSPQAKERLAQSGRVRDLVLELDGLERARMGSKRGSEPPLPPRRAIY